MDKRGTYYFFTGLAGAGKSTIGRLFYQRIKATRNDILLFDGDMIRTAREETDYSTEGRLKSCRKGMGMAKLITDQGIDIVSCAIAMYSEVYDWYRENIENFKLIYIKASMDTLYQRDQKGLYSSGATQVVGIDLPYDEPDCPDMVIENDGDETPEQIVEQILYTFGLV